MTIAIQRSVYPWEEIKQPCDAHDDHEFQAHSTQSSSVHIDNNTDGHVNYEPISQNEHRLSFEFMQ